MYKWLINKYHQLIQWEYWNTWFIYLPLAPIWIYLSIKNRSLYFFQHTNPGITFGGMAMQSKIEIYNLLPKNVIPHTIFLNKEDVKGFDTKSILNYPIIAKPNEGLKGLGLSIVTSEKELKEYLSNNHFDIIIQEKINHTIELGIFYCRLPNNEDGFITGITKKKLMTVEGNGTSTVRDLIKSNNRVVRQMKALEKTDKKMLDYIPIKGETFVLQKIGSHTRGAEFIDVTKSYCNEVYKKVNPIAKKISGFYYGRFDVLCNINPDTQQIEDFKIIELNGTMSEPIHIYNPGNSLLLAWKEIIKHWRIMSIISIQNKDQNINIQGFIKGMKLIYQNLKLENQLKKQLFG